MEEPASLITLRSKVIDLLPRVDLPELILEVAARTPHQLYRGLQPSLGAHRPSHRLARQPVRGVDGPGVQYRAGATGSRRRAGAQARSNVFGRSELPARGHARRRQCSSGVGAGSPDADQPVGCAGWRRPTACVSWCRCARCMPAPIPNTSVSGRGVTWYNLLSTSSPDSTTSPCCHRRLNTPHFRRLNIPQFDR